MARSSKGTQRHTEGGTDVSERQSTRRPKLYRVVLHNDDFTTMEFVVAVLMEFFDKSRTEATQIMLHVHTRGRGVCGVYTREIAETKAVQVTDRARDQEHPLLVTIEADD